MHVCRHADQPWVWEVGSSGYLLTRVWDCGRVDRTTFLSGMYLALPCPRSWKCLVPDLGPFRVPVSTTPRFEYSHVSS
jgi:hypothetical protein